MSQNSEQSQNSSSGDRLGDDHIAAICSSLQFHLSEPPEEVHQMRWQAVNRPDTPPQVLDHIASHGNHHLVKRVADHPQTEASTLGQLALHDHFEVRAALADNQNLPLALQWQLAQDLHPDVRFALAQCYHINANVLGSMLEDDNPFVAHRARLTLQRKNAVAKTPRSLPAPSESDVKGRRLRAFG